MSSNVVHRRQKPKEQHNKIPASYVTRGFITVFTTARHCILRSAQFIVHFSISRIIFAEFLSSYMFLPLSLSSLNDPLSNLTSDTLCLVTSLRTETQRHTHIKQQVKLVLFVCTFPAYVRRTWKINVGRTNHSNRSPYRDSNLEPPESEAVMLTAQAGRSKGVFN
jgi:hypothetical protein